MFVKQIIIQGFKSYKTQTVIEPFSDKTNVIVGRNGSGKSNFFAAIRFVLSDAYTQMSREERQGLLHEGAGTAVTSAYVEIIFDNSDGRFLTPNKEVVLRRTISLHKDECSIDRKVVPKGEVMDLLEGAGFSRSNPYYIVPQGRVTALTNMTEADRLNLLKEVAGTQVYENRRAESLRIMADTNHKREKIDELLTDVKTRLAELDEEKEELRGFQTKEREKRCLEYAFYALEQARVQKLLDELESLRQGGQESADSTRSDLAACESSIASLDEKIRRLQRELQLCEITRRQANEDRLEGTKAEAQADLKAKTLGDSQSTQEQARQEREAELEATRIALGQKEAELSKVASDLAKEKLGEDSIKKDLDTAVAARERLFTKQKNGSRFKNKRERDNELRREVEEVKVALGNQNANRMDADEETKMREESVKALEADIVALRDRLSNWGTSRTRLAQEATDAKDHHDSLQEERKKLRRDQEKLETILSNTRAEQEQAKSRLSKMMDNATARGLDTIRRFKADHNLTGAYGTIAELIEVSGTYQLPVETIAGASLFHYVVDNADTATKLGKMLYEKRGGRVTIVPLREIDSKNVIYPRGDDAVPMMEKLRYDSTYEKAIRHVFGKTVICPNLAVANQYARSHKLTAITLEGDIAAKSGALTGGFIESKHSRLEAVKEANRLSAEYDDIRSQYAELRKAVERKDQEITKAAGEMRKCEAALEREKQGFQPLQRELVELNVQLSEAKELLQASIERRDQIDINMREFAETIEAAEAEMASEFKKVLTANEEKQMEELGMRVQQLQKQWSDISVSRRQLSTRKHALEIDMSRNLQPKLDALMSQAMEDQSFIGSAEAVKDARRELARAQQAVTARVAKVQEAEQEMERVQREIEQHQTQRAQQEEARKEIQARIDRQQKRIEKNLSRKSLLTQEAADLAKSIRDLGVLPEEAFEKYKKMDAQAIVNRLKKVNDGLKKYKHVNKKAFEQYNSFTTQQEQLLDRRKDLDTSRRSIEELVKQLDDRKDQAIERTFKQVSREFANIFEKLVPAGHGRLVIIRRSDRHQQPDDESGDEAGRNGAIENYVGVGISVAFNSKTMDEQQKIQQLSGGQKSLCALCLIFALQQTESSPMVIFDEVDANLDAQYRTAVAGLLRSISDEAGTQFICTTFRPEIVQVADKCYGVTFVDKTSSIDCVSTEDALSFVEGQAKGT